MMISHRKVISADECHCDAVVRYSQRCVVGGELGIVMWDFSNTSMDLNAVEGVFSWHAAWFECSMSGRYPFLPQPECGRCVSQVL